MVARTGAFSVTFSDASAVAGRTPGLARPITSTHHMRLLVSREGDRVEPKSSKPSGAKIGCMLDGGKMAGGPCAGFAPVNPGGFTPTIVTGVEFTMMLFPITSGERAKRLVHSR